MEQLSVENRSRGGAISRMITVHGVFGVVRDETGEARNCARGNGAAQQEHCFFFAAILRRRLVAFSMALLFADLMMLLASSVFTIHP